MALVRLRSLLVSWLVPALSVTVLLVALWLICASQIASWPSFSEFRERLSVLLGDQTTYSQIALSFRRLLVGLLLSIVAGSVSAFLMASSLQWERFLRVYLLIALSVPSMVVGLLALMVLGVSEIGVFLGVAMVTFPFVTVSLQQGIRSLDSQLVEMGSVYGVGKLPMFRDVFFPHMMPLFFAAVRNVYALGWKIVVVIELFAVPSGIGYQFNRAFDFFLLGDLMSWLLFLLVAILAVEYLILGPLERRVLRWTL